MPSPAQLVAKLLALVALGAGWMAPSVDAQIAVPDSVARRIDSVFTRYGKPTSPGCALGLYRDGRIVYSKGYGSANLELGVPLSPASVFDIGSTSKQFTAMSILLLAEDGKLSLDEDVRKYLPELPDYGTPITIGHLLHHTSGLRDYTTLLVLAGEPTENWTTDDDAFEILVRQRGLNFKPGSEWQYSNSGFFLLSIIVKRVSGQSLRRFAQHRIFEPLGMTHTHIHDDHTMVVPSRAIGYVPSDSGGPFRIEMSDWEQTGDGSVLTTVEDLVKWDENFYSGQVGGSAVLAAMVKPGTLANGKVLDYASGLFLGEYRGLKIVEHGGAWAGYRAQLLRFPSEHVSVACLCNLGSADPEGMAQRVADVYLADQLGPPRERVASASDTVAGAGSPMLPPERLRAAVGTYRNPKQGDVARIVATDGKLDLKYGGGSFALQPVSPAEFKLADLDVRLRLIPADSGRPRRIQLIGSGLNQPTLEEVTPYIPAAAALRDFPGEYFSSELQSTYRVALEKGALVLHARHLPVTPLEPTIRDEFEYPAFGVTLHFTRRSGRVNGFDLASGRSRGIRFERRQSTSSLAPPRGR
jgi:CubicO group peptidase (beta-lactamase class C family)